MPILNSRRYRQQPSEIILLLVSFLLRQEWFAVPIEAVYRVIPIDSIYGDPQNTGISLTRYQNQEILVIDVAKQIFGEMSSLKLKNRLEQRYLVLIQAASGELIGLPIDSPPSIQRIAQTALTNIPKTYMLTGNIRCISSQMVQIPDHPALFLLDPQQLVRSS